MHALDWAIIGLHLVLVTAIGFFFIRRASGSVAQYFVAGRNLPWWLAGTSLIATSFASDTPLFVAGLIATRGIAGNWLWWNQAVVWSLAVVFFARLWRRAGLITDAEFIELRYDGAPAAFLRGFRALYMSLIFSTVTIAWVMLAMQKIVAQTLARPAWVDGLQRNIEISLNLAPGTVDIWKWLVLLALLGVATFYTVLSGAWGIVVTDLYQFAVAIAGSIVFAVYAADSVGGIAALKEKLLVALGPERTANVFSFLPQRDSVWMPISLFMVYLGIYWWGDCGQFAAQRMFSTRTERDSVLTAIWYSVAHFALRPWPWIIVGIVALLHYPNMADPESGYPRLMMEILPTGMRGLLIASLLAAFMSTVDTHLNWNASYFVTDVYRRFLAPDASEKRCVLVSRLSVLAYATLAIIVAYFMTSIEKGVIILFNLQAGIGLVLMLRWFWWRINAWSEISAMIASLVVNTALPLLDGYYQWKLPLATQVCITVIFCTTCWLTVTLLTRPVSAAHLEAFYRRTRPGSLLWGPIARRCADVAVERGTAAIIIAWLAGAGVIYAATFLIGKLILQEYRHAAISAVILAGLIVVLWCIFRRRGNPLAGLLNRP